MFRGKPSSSAAQRRRNCRRSNSCTSHLCQWLMSMSKSWIITHSSWISILNHFHDRTKFIQRNAAALASDLGQTDYYKIHHRENLPEVSLNRTDICPPATRQTKNRLEFFICHSTTIRHARTLPIRLLVKWLRFPSTHAVELSRPLDLEAVEWKALETKCGKMLRYNFECSYRSHTSIAHNVDALGSRKNRRVYSERDSYSYCHTQVLFSRNCFMWSAKGMPSHGETEKYAVNERRRRLNA